jgi:hypothetical protein
MTVPARRSAAIFRLGVDPAICWPDFPSGREILHLTVTKSAQPQFVRSGRPGTYPVDGFGPACEIASK